MRMIRTLYFDWNTVTLLTKIKTGGKQKTRHVTVCGLNADSGCGSVPDRYRMCFWWVLQGSNL